MNNIVLVGAGGTGMSGLAMLLFDIGYKNIICINNIQTNLTDHLKTHGLKVIIGHGKYEINIKDFVIYSDIQAIIDGPEIVQSRIHQQKPTKKHFHTCITYNQFIAEISKHFTTISVSGSNGKTSTTAMAIWSLSHLVPDRFALGIVGGLMPNFNNQGYAISGHTGIQSDIHHLFEHIFNQKNQLNYSLLKKYIFVIEACEHREHFLLYDTDYTIITNVAWDHTDYYHTRKSYQDAFANMINTTRKQSIITQSTQQTLSEYQLEKITISQLFEFKNETLIGAYNTANAGMIRALLDYIDTTSHKREDTKGLDDGNLKLEAILHKFQGVGRRMEYLGTISDTAIYSDYSHHAPAIEGNIQALKKTFPDKKLCIIFQPHQAQRVLAGRNEFQKSLQDIDTTIIYKLYTARENFEELQHEFPRLAHITNFDQLGTIFAQELNAQYITEINVLLTHIVQLGDDYVVVLFSAGDLDEQIRKHIT